MKNFSNAYIKISKLGFSLIELIVAIGVAAIISGTLLYFLNPASQFAQARNNQRTSHINIIASAVRSRMTDNHGIFQTNCSSGPLPSTTTQMGSGAGNYNAEPCVVPIYISVMPLDPSVGTSTATGYSIIYNSTTAQITISAPNAELGQTISITR